MDHPILADTTTSYNHTNGSLAADPNLGTRRRNLSSGNVNRPSEKEKEFSSCSQNLEDLVDDDESFRGRILANAFK